MDAGRQAMAIAHMTLWVRWAKKGQRTNNDQQNTDNLKIEQHKPH
jgi:hypothetical protein